MLKKLFNDKKFIFIFTFLVELILYYVFEYLYIGGIYIVPDIGIAPIFGLMFGPVGGLGQAIAVFVFEIYEGLDFTASLIDAGIMFFSSILTYALWYNIFKKREINTPKFDSVYNVLKFFIIMFLVSIVYLAFLNILLELYPPFNVIYPLPHQFRADTYFFDMLNFSVVFGLMFISLFNVFSIPLQMPNKLPNLFNIKSKYFSLSFCILFAYLIINDALNLNFKILNICFVISFVLLALLFCFNKFDTNIKTEKSYYSIIEQIILISLFILAIITSFLIFLTWSFITKSYLRNLDFGLLVMVVFSLASAFVLMLFAFYILFIERTVTDPIYDLIDALEEYGANKTVNEGRRAHFVEHLKSDDDISNLVESFSSLYQQISYYLERIKKTVADNERIETELNVASNIQSGMLRTDFKEFPKDNSFEIYGFMSPARDVGGDFYDYFQIDENDIGFVIGDVGGKGVPATLFMIKTMYLIRNHNKFMESPKEVFENVNNLSIQRNDEDLSLTSWFGKLNLKTGKLTFVNAGHYNPLIRHSPQENESDESYANDNNAFEYINTPSNLVLGTIEGISYQQNEFSLNPGDIIFLYTNGIIEANNNFQERYGEDRLKNIIHKYEDESLEEIAKKIKNDVYEFCGDENQFDDMTMLIIKYNGYENGGYENGGYENGGYENGGYENNGYESIGYKNNGCEKNG